MNVLCCDNDCVLAGHTRGKLGAHGCDEFLQILTILAGVVRDGDNLQWTRA